MGTSDSELYPPGSLIARWRDYRHAMRDQPYDRDRVQALGMAFADRWHANEDRLREIAKDIGVDEFDYGAHHVVMRAVDPE